MCDVECDERYLGEISEEEFLKKEKERLKRRYLSRQNRKKRGELEVQARKELAAELQIDEKLLEPEEIRIRDDNKSKMSDAEYERLVALIYQLVGRNCEIVNTFTDKTKIEEVVQERLTGTLVDEYLNNERLLHTYLDRIQCVNVGITYRTKNFNKEKSYD